MLHPQSLIIRYTDAHTNTYLCLVFGEKLWNGQLWSDGERHAGSTFPSRGFRANFAHSGCTTGVLAGLTATDGNCLIISLVSGLTTNIQCIENQQSSAYIFIFLFWLYFWILKGVMKKHITSLLLCNAHIVFQTAKTGVSGTWPMSIPGFRCFLMSARRGQDLGFT